MIEDMENSMSIRFVIVYRFRYKIIAIKRT